MALVSDLMGVGVPSAPAQLLGYDAVAITAAGTSQSDGATLTGTMNIVTISGIAVVLPATMPLYVPVTVVNTFVTVNASQLVVFPFVGGAFDALAANASISLRPGGSLTFVRTGTTTISTIAVNDGQRILGNSGLYYNQNVMVSTNRTQTGTGSNTTATALWSFALPAGSLMVNGRGLRIKAFGTFAANGNNKTAVLTFGGTTIATTGTVAANNVTWLLEADLQRVSNTTQIAIGSAQYGTTFVAPLVSNPGETLTGAVTITMTGTNGTASANDIVFLGGTIESIG